MFTDKFQLRVPLLRLLVGLLITVVPISLIALYAVARSDDSMKEMVGSHFQSIAIVTAGDVSQFVNDRVISAGTLAANPIITEACGTANEQYGGISPEAIQERMQRVEKIWNTAAGDAMAREMLGSRASKVLNQYREIDRRFLRITLTDRSGAVIAATHKTLDYYQADEEFWQGVYSNGRGAVSITDILYDEVTKSNYIGLGVPVMAPGSNVLVGVLDALIEVSSLFPIVHRAELGRTGRILLLKADGTVIQAPDTSLSMNVKSGEFAAIRDAGGLASINLRGHLATTVGGVPAIVAYASTGLQEHYPKLGWSIVVAQDSQEALAPTRVIVRLISFMALVGLAMVTLLAMYFSLHRERDYTDIKALRTGVKTS
ncbi:MAG: cache domain-containing protein [Bryobacterales bacterium]|nr:cache domain-containing protein [Bryobacterales bacterium]